MFDCTLSAFEQISYDQWGHYQKTEFKVFCTTPLEVSLKRAKAKILWNVVPSDYNQHTFERPFLITLTIDDKHYEEACLKQPLSVTWSKFYNKLRNYIRRGSQSREPSSFECVWRIERGTSSTERYHIHILAFTDASAIVVRNYVEKRWIYCDWKVLHSVRASGHCGERGLSAADACFEADVDEKFAAIYAAKYTTKGFVGGKMAHTRSEAKGRIIGFTRGFSPIPKYLRPWYLINEKRWIFKFKDMYCSYIPTVHGGEVMVRNSKGEEFQISINWGPFQEIGVAQKIFFNKKAIKSFNECENYRDDFLNRYQEFESDFQIRNLSPEEFAKFSEKFNWIMENFSYDKAYRRKWDEYKYKEKTISEQISEIDEETLIWLRTDAIPFPQC